MKNVLTKIKRDNEGFLLNLTDWQPNIAEAIALEDGIQLTNEHWEIINTLRAFYAEYNTSPPIRALLNILATKIDKEKVNSIYLHKLFPEGPAKQANKIAGLPKPVRCI